MRLFVPGAMALGILLLMFSMAVAQDSPAPLPTATSPFDLNAPPTIAPLTTATAPPSLTGVNGYAVKGPVSIRSGPGLGYPIIGVLGIGRSIDIIGYNGYDLNRPCTANFAGDLDMWVLVTWRGGEAWMARCALRITGARNMPFLLRSDPPPGAPLPTGYPTPVPGG
jgi:hypothetical protein